MKARRAFTLIELLIVVVIIGILAAIAIPKFAATKQKALVANLKSDLRNMATAQESYFYNNGTYAPNSAMLFPTFAPSSGVTLTIVESSNGGWSGRATDARVPDVCALFYGSAAPVAPATGEGVVTCQ